MPEFSSHTLLTTRDLSVHYGRTLALEGASFTLNAGEFVGVLGPNGAGKSTLLKALLGLTPLSGGSLEWAAELGARPRDSVAYVPQQGALDWDFPLSVWDAAMMGRVGRLGWLRRAGALERDKVTAALEAVGMLTLKNRPLSDLSGGQRQRVLLARMLVREARVLLLDEPLSGVDAQTSRAVMTLLTEQCLLGKAVLMVTHDLEAAALSCDRLMLINRQVRMQGRSEEVYTPENVARAFASV